MSKRLHFAFSLVFVLTLAGNCFAVNWSDGGSDHLWSTGLNWIGGNPPTSGQDVFIGNNATGPTIDSTVTAVAAIIRMGGTGTTDNITITGGTLNSGHLILGEGTGSNVTMDMSGGTANVYSVWVGNNGDGVLNMTGGTMNISGEPLYVSRFGGAGHVQLDGGTINTDNFTMYDATASMDITVGTLIINGNVTGTISTYIGNGWITAFGGDSTINVVYNSSTTTVTAEPMIRAWSPNPEDGSGGVETDAELSWLAGDGAVSHDVYLGMTNPPGFMQNQPGTTYNPGTLSLNTTYYWRIDEVNGGTVTGDVWSFTVRDQTTAWNPDPVSGASGVASDAILSWSSGTQTVSHDVYFGTTNPPAFIQNQPLGQESYNPPGDFIKGQTYYWKIDEVNGLDTYEGIVWDFTVVAGAANLSWDDGGADHLWTTSANWNPDDVPGLATDVSILNSGSGPLIDSTVTAVCTVIRQGGSGLTNTFDMTGGSFTTSSDFILGESSGSTAIFNMDGGSVEAYSIWVGNVGDGELNMNAGTINVTDEPLYVSKSSANTGIIRLNGGTIYASDFQMPNSALMDVAGGKLVVDGDKTVAVNSYISNGWIIGYNDTRPVEVVYNGSTTTVRAFAADWPYAHSPVPVDGYYITLADSNLSWQPGAFATSHNVYFGTNFDEVNEAMPAAGDFNFDGVVDVGDLGVLTGQWLTDPGSSNPSADIDGDGTVDAEDFAKLAAGWKRPTPYKGNQAGTEYAPTVEELGDPFYWRIDEVNDSTVWKGEVWSFDDSSPYAPPIVWAGYDPDAGAYNETIIAEWDVGNVHYKDFYISVYLKGEEIRMYCKYAAQSGATNQPAILNIHGWYGAPSLNSEFINRGYAVMSYDYSGDLYSRTEYTKYPPALAHGNQISNTRIADPDVKATSDYIWDAQARRALSYMATQPEVDTDRMGASGFSYGGTVIWSLAMDPRIKAACAFHGMGWIKYYRDHHVWRYDLTPPAIEPTEEELIYLAGIAPQAYSPYINCPVLFLNGSNDHHGNQDRSYQTLDLLPDGVPWATAQQVNTAHNTDAVGHILYPWMQKWVKGESVTWPDNPESEIRLGAGDVPEFVLDPASPADVASVEIYYALEEPFNYERTWFYANVVRTGDTWTALLPVNDVDEYVFGYANITYNSTIVISSNFEAEVPSWIGAP